MNTELFIFRSKLKHGENYDYSKTNYINSLTKVVVICKKHNLEIRVTPYNHFIKRSCKLCIAEIMRSKFVFTKEMFIEKANKIHNNFYDYSLVEYKTAREKVKIICPTHGIFEQIPDSHLRGKKCRKCSKEIASLKTVKKLSKFIEQANNLHNFRYDYKLSNYIKDFEKLEIICKKHGSFWQSPTHHLQGKGCAKCARENITLYQINNPTGWSLKSWIEKSKTSKKFDSFKVYILECWNEEEKFYKIGRTFLTVKQRFSFYKRMPYNYKIVKEILGEAEYIFNLETELKNKNKHNKYVPKIKFEGAYECFNKLENDTF